ncbi:hypothetical protein [Streptomyces sp. NPDC048521]|uniref:hypothetical protein n=1 Tax=Streptomyces sp. NPDC048521 TaxID=3365566 RepID=UPI0037195D18
MALLLTGPVYGLGSAAVGLLALVNAVTMFVTPFAGRLVDRRGADAVNRLKPRSSPSAASAAPPACCP